MGPNELNGLHVAHVGAILALFGCTFYACAAPPETRKRVLIAAGVASLVVLLTGLRLWQRLYGFTGAWVVGKMICWLGLSALAGLAYRQRARAGWFAGIALALAVVALLLVYFKPGL